MIVAISGASGLIGSALCSALRLGGHEVRKLVRGDAVDGEQEITWNPERGTIDLAELNGLDAVIHLAGRNIATRWNSNVKQQILDSRVTSTRLLASSLAQLEYRPAVFLCASAIGFYGDQGDQLVDEDSQPGDNLFLADVCRQWEGACQQAVAAGIRVVHLRTGIVLSPRGGALAKMLTPFRLGLGGVVGSGRQYMSWIALDDEVRAIQFLLERDEVRGAANLVAPHPVTNRQFTKTLGKVLSRPTFFPMPAAAARLAFGEMADELLLASTRVAPRRLEEAGFQFQHPELEGALRHLLARS